MLSVNLWLLQFSDQFFCDGVNIDVDAQLLHVPSHPPVPIEKRDLWKFMSKSLVGDHKCWTSAYPSSQGVYKRGCRNLRGLHRW